MTKNLKIHRKLEIALAAVGRIIHVVVVGFGTTTGAGGATEFGGGPV